MPFENKILLRLRRKYSRDEEMKFLLDLLRETQIKNGKLLAELAEVNHVAHERLMLAEQLESKVKKATKEKLIDARIESMQKGINSRAKTNARLERDLVYWRNRCCSIEATLDKLKNEIPVTSPKMGEALPGYDDANIQTPNQSQQ